jgi:AcrR family transcriptional regulator
MKRKPSLSKSPPAGKPVARGTAWGGARRFAPATEWPEDIRDAVSNLKRERIIAVAVEFFYSDGFNNTTLEAVAEAMKVTKPFIYSHFASKSQLLAEICGRGMRASLDAVQKAVSLGGSPTERLRSMAHEFTLAVLTEHAYISIYKREEKHLSAKDCEAIIRLRREFDREFAAVLKEGADAGEFNVDDVNLAAMAIVGMVCGVSVWYRPAERLPPAETAENIAALVLKMVGAKTARSRRPQLAVSASAG